ILLACMAIPVLSLPLVTGTKTYPVTLVDGNSMYPNLESGDVVVYHKADIANIGPGTIIVYVQGQTGIPILDSMLKPVIIHRVTEMIVQDGQAYYGTKGDNNQVADPILVKYADVLGTPSLILPKIGLPLLFLKSVPGLRLLPWRRSFSMCQSIS